MKWGSVGALLMGADGVPITGGDFLMDGLRAPMAQIHGRQRSNGDMLWVHAADGGIRLSNAAFGLARHLQPSRQLTRESVLCRLRGFSNVRAKRQPSCCY
jgi:hypothetical protein